MSTETVQITASKPTATLIIAAGEGPHLVKNLDPINTVFLGDNNTIQSTDPTVIPLQAGTSVAVDGRNDLYGVTAPSITVQVSKLLGGLSSFLNITFANGILSIPGFLVYFNNNPGANNLAQAIGFGTQTTDQFGNVVFPGESTYTNTGGSNWVCLNIFGSQIRSFFSSTGQAGPWTLGAFQTFFSTGFTLEGNYSLLDQTGNNGVLLNTGNFSLINILNGVQGIATNAALLNSWTGTLTYKRMIDESVAVNGIVTAPAGVTNPSTIFTFPANYIPATTNQYLSCVEDPGGAHLGQALICQVNTTGNLQIFDATAGQTSRISGRFFLDA